MDNCCPRGHRPTKTNEPTRKPKITDKNSFRPQESKAQALQRSENADTSEDKARKDKKKRERQDKPDRQHRERGQEGSTSAIRVNATNTLGGHSSGNRGERPQRDPVQVIYYNCNKKRHFARNCLEFQKPKN